MNYTAEGRNHRHFVLMNDQGTELGRLDYTTWMQIKAKIELADGRILEIQGADFWHTSLQATDAGTMVATMKFNWKGEMIISINDGHTYKLKHRGILNSAYVVLNEHDEELMVLHPNFQFRKMSYSYTIETSGDAMDPQMILLAIYCVNYRIYVTAGAS